MTTQEPTQTASDPPSDPADTRAWLTYLDAPADSDMDERVRRLQQACRVGVPLGELLIGTRS